MSKEIRYTCAKKREPVFREDCMKCPEYKPCAIDGKWCFVGALIAEHDPMAENASAPLIENAAMPVMRDMSTVDINLGDGKKISVLREDIKKQLERELYKGIGLQYGG